MTVTTVTPSPPKDKDSDFSGDGGVTIGDDANSTVASSEAPKAGEGVVVPVPGNYQLQDLTPDFTGEEIQLALELAHTLEKGGRWINLPNIEALIEEKMGNFVELDTVARITKVLEAAGFATDKEGWLHPPVN